MDFNEVVRKRRMTRSFKSRPVEESVVRELIELATRAPSAGKTQGLHVITLVGDALTNFWKISFPAERRTDFKWPGLFDAPVVTLWLADPDAYVARYSEPDKTHTGLGAGVDAWPTPYWTVDGSMALGTFLLAVENAGLGALLFAVFNNVGEIRQEFAIPDGLQILGAVAIGVADETTSLKGVSANRPRRSVDSVVHRNHW